MSRRPDASSAFCPGGRLSILYRVGPFWPGSVWSKTWAPLEDVTTQVFNFQPIVLWSQSSSVTGSRSKYALYNNSSTEAFSSPAQMLGKRSTLRSTAPRCYIAPCKPEITVFCSLNDVKQVANPSVGCHYRPMPCPCTRRGLL